MSLHFLFRALVPTWRFFEEYVPGRSLRLRIGREQKWGEWRVVSDPPVPRSFKGLWINSAANVQLAYQDILERLVDELSDSDGVALRRGTTYQLILARLRNFLSRSAPSLDGQHFQFKIVDNGEDIFVSEGHPC